MFPGQDYNNARIYDFEDVDKWENNKRKRRLTPWTLRLRADSQT